MPDTEKRAEKKTQENVEPTYEELEAEKERLFTEYAEMVPKNFRVMMPVLERVFEHSIEDGLDLAKKVGTLKDPSKVGFDGSNGVIVHSLIRRKVVEKHRAYISALTNKITDLKMDLEQKNARLFKFNQINMDGTLKPSKK